ncbi:alpha/beta hydrolase [Ruegeria sediminis]|uniref:Alpha/beta hydrolase n=1 Tax=Ruegeria sediminis TaxID=2583820 RepID=A0ABY2WSC2_9RHOB|nr:alpha/beta hydrolase [Ruegeria sediminis]TMV03317.1 alpha/beta hydrolase [Ruegeria sediminis]
MADKWHVEWLKEGVAKWNKRRKRVDFRPDLSGIRFFELLPPDFRDDPKTSRYFERIDLTNANLSGADLSDLNFYEACFVGADLSHSNMSKSNFAKVNFLDANLVGADAYRSNFKGARFENTILENTRLDAVEADGAVFIGSPISNEQLGILGQDRIRIFESRASFLDARVVHERLGKSANRPAIKKEDKRTRKNRYDVFFGTNRKPLIARGAVVDFCGERAERISNGICEVIVPNGHKIGSLGSPLWKRLLNRSDDRLRVDDIISLNEEIFFAHIRQSLAKMKVQEKPTIFIHGYNTNFREAVLRAAQIGFDLGLGLGIGLYSWPSKGVPHGYSADEATVEVSKYFLADFIEQFVENTQEKSINIIAHSMGCRCLLGAFEVLSNGRQNILKAINQTILAAADVDSSAMVYLGKHAVDNCTRTTSYVCDKDKALLVSQWLHDFHRVGIMPPTFVLNGMDTVIVNSPDLGDFSHGYISSSRTILNDIFALLKSNTPPSDRYSLVQHDAAGAICWRLKE